MLVLPIRLWLLLGVVAAVVWAAAWLRKAAVLDVRSARAVNHRTPVLDVSLEDRCRSAVARHELSTPDRVNYVAVMSPLEFSSGRDRAKTPISLVLSERTMCVMYKRGALGDVVAFLVNHRDVRGAQSGETPKGPACMVETLNGRIFRLLLADNKDFQALADWASARVD